MTFYHGDEKVAGIVNRMKNNDTPKSSIYYFFLEPVWLGFLHLFAIYFDFKKDINPFGCNLFHSPF